ncbi:hypothetical protein IM043_gp129 [Bacillus phage SPG24]|nr:hypothetical protein IM043_gp129 [Bacillus phage SPG24]
MTTSIVAVILLEGVSNHLTYSLCMT